MSTTTTNLGLFKYDTTVDGQLAFNINQALNDNWDILDKSTLNGDIITLGSSGTQSLTNNRVHKITCNGNTTFSLPTGSGTEFKEIVVLLYMPTAYSISLGTSVYFGDSTPDMSNSGYYTIIYEYDPIRSSWVVGVLSKETGGITPVEYPWTQPVLSANGTLGGDSFAVYASEHFSSCYPYCAVDGVNITSYKNGNQWLSQDGVDFIFYNPIPLKVSTLEIKGGYGSTYNYRAYQGTVSASDTNSNYTQIGSWSVSSTTAATVSITVDLSTNENYYKYYKLHPSTFINSTYWGISELYITATYLG